MKELSALIQSSKTLFNHLYEVINEQNTASKEITSFFTANDIFKLAEEAINEDCDIFQVEVVVEKIGIISSFNIESIINYIKALYKNTKEYYPCSLESIFTTIAIEYLLASG